MTDSKYFSTTRKGRSQFYVHYKYFESLSFYITLMLRVGQENDEIEMTR